MFHLFEATEIGLVYKAYHVYWSSVWKSQYTHWFTMYEYFDADYHKYVLTGLNVGKYSFFTAHPLLLQSLKNVLKQTIIQVLIQINRVIIIGTVLKINIRNFNFLAFERSLVYDDSFIVQILKGRRVKRSNNGSVRDVGGCGGSRTVKGL